MCQFCFTKIGKQCQKAKPDVVLHIKYFSYLHSEACSLWIRHCDWPGLEQYKTHRYLIQTKKVGSEYPTQIVCICVWARMCHSAHREQMSRCTQYVCVWSALAALVMRRVRPECMAWFSQCADESWQLQDSLLLLVRWLAPDQALTPPLHLW